MMDDEEEISLYREIRGQLRFRRKLDYLKPIIATVMASIIVTIIHSMVDNVNGVAIKAYWESYERHVEDSQRYDPCTGSVLRERSLGR